MKEGGGEMEENPPFVLLLFPNILSLLSCAGDAGAVRAARKTLTGFYHVLYWIGLYNTWVTYWAPSVYAQSNTTSPLPQYKSCGEGETQDLSLDPPQPFARTSHRPACTKHYARVSSRNGQDEKVGQDPLLAVHHPWLGIPRSHETTQVERGRRGEETLETHGRATRPASPGLILALSSHQTDPPSLILFGRLCRIQVPPWRPRPVWSLFILEPSSPIQTSISPQICPRNTKNHYARESPTSSPPPSSFRSFLFNIFHHIRRSSTSLPFSISPLHYCGLRSVIFSSRFTTTLLLPLLLERTLLRD